MMLISRPYRQMLVRLIWLCGAATLMTQVTFAQGVQRTADSESASLMEWPYQGKPNAYHMCCGEFGSYEYMKEDIDNRGPRSARGGQYFLKLTRTADQPSAYPPDQNNGNRVEVTTASEFVERAMEDRWFGMSIWVPSWVDTSPVTSWNSIGQWHGSSGNEPGIIHLWHDSDDNLVIETRTASVSLPKDWWNYTTDTVHYSGPMPKDQWIDLVFNYRFDHTESGFFRVWMNGRQIVDYSGPVGFKHSPGDSVAYVKIGNYAGDKHPYNRTYYYDEVRWGDASASFDSVSPSSYAGSRSANAVPNPPTLVDE